MKISELYSELDRIEDMASVVADEFSKDGDLKLLAIGLRDLGNRAYTAAGAADNIESALKDLDG